MCERPPASEPSLFCLGHLFFSQALAYLEKNAVEFRHLFRGNLYALCPKSCHQQSAAEPHDKSDQQSEEGTNYGDGQEQPNSDA